MNEYLQTSLTCMTCHMLVSLLLNAVSAPSVHRATPTHLWGSHIFFDVGGQPVLLQGPATPPCPAPITAQSLSNLGSRFYVLLLLYHQYPGASRKCWTLRRCTGKWKNDSLKLNILLETPSSSPFSSSAVFHAPFLHLFNGWLASARHYCDNEYPDVDATN